jgi:hypothetical protein
MIRQPVRDRGQPRGILGGADLDQSGTLVFVQCQLGQQFVEGFRAEFVALVQGGIHPRVPIRRNGHALQQPGHNGSRVDPHGNVLRGEAQGPKKIHRHEDALRVRQFRIAAHDIDIPLEKLAQAPTLRPLRPAQPRD